MDNNVVFGKHPLVIRFMRGVFNQRPTRARYNEIWNVSDVLNRLEAMSPVATISYKLLLQKALMLTALISAARLHTLHKLDVNIMRKGKSSFTFNFNSVMKQSRDGFAVQPLTLRAYPHRRLCIYTIIKEILRRRRTLNITCTSIFTTTRKPFKRISKITLANWLKQTLKESGVDTSVYKAHSVRTAAVNKAKESDLPIDHILKTAGWANDSMFRKYYHKPAMKQAFAEAVLLR